MLLGPLSVERCSVSASEQLQLASAESRNQMNDPHTECCLAGSLAALRQLNLPAAQSRPLCPAAQPGVTLLQSSDRPTVVQHSGMHLHAVTISKMLQVSCRAAEQHMHGAYAMTHLLTSQICWRRYQGHPVLVQVHNRQLPAYQPPVRSGSCHILVPNKQLMVYCVPEGLGVEGQRDTILSPLPCGGSARGSLLGRPGAHMQEVVWPTLSPLGEDCRLCPPARTGFSAPSSRTQRQSARACQDCTTCWASHAMQTAREPGYGRDCCATWALWSRLKGSLHSDAHSVNVSATLARDRCCCKALSRQLAVCTAGPRQTSSICKGEL